MSFIEIFTIIACISIVFGNVFAYFCRKSKNLPVGECAYCKSHDILKEYRKFVKRNK